MTPVFVFDGDCAFCSACARFVERRIPTRATVVPWQFADLGALGLTAAECDAAVQWVEHRAGSSADEPARSRLQGSLALAPRASRARPEPPRRVAGPAAIAALLRDSRWYWRPIGQVLGWRPVLAVAWPAYRWVSRNRHRMPGGTPACSLPAAQRETHAQV